MLDQISRFCKPTPEERQKIAEGLDEFGSTAVLGHIEDYMHAVGT